MADGNEATGDVGGSEAAHPPSRMEAQEAAVSKTAPSAGKDGDERDGEVRPDAVDLSSLGGDERPSGRGEGAGDDGTMPRRRERSKRKRSDNVISTVAGGDADMLAAQICSFQHSPAYLRIPASSVAGLCGLHPFQHLPRLLFDLVYQSFAGQLLLQRDASALGLTLVDAASHERESMLALASAASKETKELVQKALEVSDGKRSLKSVEEVKSMQEKIRSGAAEAEKKGALSKKQVESLVEATRSHVSTGFGTHHEDSALDIYERMTGSRVRERNEALMEWRFRRVVALDDEDVGGGGGLGVTAAPMGAAKRREWGRSGGAKTAKDETDRKGEGSKQDGTAECPIEIDDDSDEDDDGDNSSGADANDSKANVNKNVNRKGEEPEKPFFRIVGAVDGIRDELYVSSAKKESPQPPAKGEPGSAMDASERQQQHNTASNDDDAYNFSDNDEDEWAFRPIIVECKHRMSEAKVPPPLYDQIQTCLYCHMYGVEDADLVQVVRRKRKRVEKNGEDGSGEGKENHAQTNGAAAGETKGSNGSTKGDSEEDINVTVTRVSLNDPLHDHGRQWTATLLPRLASFVDAVYSLRADDGKRYRLLTAMVRAQDDDGAHGGASDAAEEECWRVLWDECPWLRHCDTSFGRRRRF